MEKFILVNVENVRPAEGTYLPEMRHSRQVATSVELIQRHTWKLASASTSKSLKVKDSGMMRLILVSMNKGKQLDRVAASRHTVLFVGDVQMPN
jgi:hypothetical protein